VRAKGLTIASTVQLGKARTALMRTEAGDRTTQEQDRLMQARFKDQAHMHTLRMWVRNVFFFVGTVVVLIIWQSSSKIPFRKPNVSWPKAKLVKVCCANMLLSC